VENPTRVVLSKTRVVLLNALPIQAFNYQLFKIGCKRTSVDAVRDILVNATILESYVRHEATVKVLSELAGRELPVSAGLYRHREGDVLVIVTLKTPQRGVEVTQLSIDNLDFLLCIAESVV